MSEVRKPWRIAVAGCGGAAYGIHLPVLSAHPAFEVIAVADREPGRAEHAAAQFGIAKVARDDDDLIDGADMLAVLTGVHEPWIERALSAGVHVFTEKPVSLDIAKTRRFRQQAARSGLLLEVGAVRAHDGAVDVLLQHLSSGDLRGGWLVKADGTDERERRQFLPPAADAYTFSADPPQPCPAGLSTAGQQALKILLWQGYHLLTVLALVSPRAQPVACTVTGTSVHACVRAPNGALIALTVGAAPPGTHIDQALFTGPTGTTTATFGPPYGPAGPGQVIAYDPQPSPVPIPPMAPADRMWSAIARRLITFRQQVGGGTGDLAEVIERLAYRLACLANGISRMQSQLQEAS
ncbi:Gfo/Idh/MocA family protein [Microtetraspora niveoalba]|uniref:Gfo/Idh/MocA family protein n=1 Tax=Microtetraspora niveoalba TaxID=46175 RepID=UPI00082FE1AE|nr:Gfo/Idh/MocA family oxidoreductase [Microtetraspora niveoalba]